ncbi:MAG: dextranase [Frankiaceae bacterium]|nr:dextranase [Frankiaceae bacterium]
MPLEVLPLRAAFAAGAEVVVDIRGPGADGTLVVYRLGVEVLRLDVAGSARVSLGQLAAGGYGVELTSDGGSARTAVDVVPAGADRARYGFVVDYRPGRATNSVADNVRRLHLTDVQFYDWAYRHADLVGGGETYDDALDQPISLETVRRLVDAVREAGSRALGYAAVYAVGNAEWDEWSDAALLTAEGDPYALGDFLQLVDPADPRWSKHFTEDLRAAIEVAGFDGFHLDQYGYPKHASRVDGARVRVEDSFASLIDDVRAALPASRLIFNNVNDFPTWRTAASPQDVVYIEAWAPHTTIGHLAQLVRRAASVAGGKPIVVAAYQHVYDHAEPGAADAATAFTMATLFSHGAAHLLCGEDNRILVDPYYVRNHEVTASTAALLKRWYDFQVEHVELLQDPSLVDVTGAFVGTYNDDCTITYDDVDVVDHPVAGTVWCRVTEAGSRLIVHLINLVGQTDTEWDAARNPVETVVNGQLRLRLYGPDVPRIRVADPDNTSRLIDVPVRMQGTHAVASLPSPGVWQVVVIDQ